MRASPHADANFWPTPDQELLLRAALLPEPEAADAWCRLQRHLHPDRLDPGSRRLLPLLHRRLRRHGIEAPWAARIREAYRHTWSRNQVLLRRGALLLDVLADAGIDTMLLKGAALIGPFYGGDPGLRPMADLDLLVPFEAAGRAAEALGRHGWRAVHPLTPSFLRVKHAGPFRGEGGRHCDLHWRVFEDDPSVERDRSLWAAASTHTFEGRRTRILSASDQLLHVCVHGARWTRDPGIRWVGDAALVLSAGGIDWRRVIEQAVTRRFLLRIGRALAYLRARLEAPVPDAVLEELASRRVSLLEHVERWVLAREHRLLGQLPLYWCHHRRACAGPFTAARTFPRYLQQAWGVESAGGVVSGSLRRAANRLRGVRRRA